MRRSITLTVTLAAAVSGCASTPPPREELARAEQAISRAEQEGASQYAPLPLRKAEEELEDARRAMKDDRNREARREAELARTQAELATATAQRARAQELVEELSRTVGALEEDTRLEEDVR
jgi:hypothetical protein